MTGFWKDIFDFARKPLRGIERVVPKELAIEEGVTSRTEGLGDYPYLIYRASDDSPEIRVNTYYAATEEGFVIHISNEGGHDSFLCSSEAEYWDTNPAEVDYAVYCAYMSGAR